MARDKGGDPRGSARRILERPKLRRRDRLTAAVWALISISDGLHRIDKALEMSLDPQEVNRRRSTARDKAEDPNTELVA